MIRNFNTEAEYRQAREAGLIRRNERYRIARRYEDDFEYYLALANDEIRPGDPVVLDNHYGIDLGNVRRFDITLTYKREARYDGWTNKKYPEKTFPFTMSLVAPAHWSAQDVLTNNRAEIDAEAKEQAEAHAYWHASGGDSQDFEWIVMNVKIDNIKAHEVAEVKENDMLAQEMKDSYIVFDGLEDPNHSHDGLCVLRALTGLGFKEDHIRAWFKDHDINVEYGVCAVDLAKFCSAHKIRMYAFDLLYNCLFQNKDEVNHAERTGHGKALMFVIADNHIYEIKDKSLRKGLCQGTRASNHLMIEAEIKPNKAKPDARPLKPLPQVGGESGKCPSYLDLDKNTRYYHQTNDADLTKIFVEIFRVTNTLPNHRVQGSKITRVDLPNGSTVYSHGQIDQALAICDELKMPFVGQGLASLLTFADAPSLLPCYGAMNDEVMSVIEKSFVPPFIHTFQNVSKEELTEWHKSGLLVSQDITRCFSSIGKEYRLPVMNLFCEVRRMDIVRADTLNDYNLYEVESTNWFPLNGNGFYYGVLLNHCKKVGVDFRPTGLIVKPARTVDCLKSFVEYAYEKRAGLAKHLVNVHIGLMGRTRERSNRTIYAVKPLEASYYAMRLNGRVHVVDNGEDFLRTQEQLREEVKRQQEEDYVANLIARSMHGVKSESPDHKVTFPIYREGPKMPAKKTLYRIGCEIESIPRVSARPAFTFIYQVAGMKLHQLYLSMATPGAVPLCIKVDAVHMKMPAKPKGKKGRPSKTVVLGAYRKEKTPYEKQDVDTSAGDDIHGLKANDPVIPRTSLFDLVPLEFNEIVWGEWKNEEATGKLFYETFPNGCLCDNPGGYGKTELAKNLMAHFDTAGVKYQCLSFTNLASDNLDGETFHKFFRVSQEDQMKQSKEHKFLRDLEVILVDEHSMTSEFLYTYLFAMKRRGKKIYLFGHFAQHKPIGDEKVARYARFIKELTDSRKLKLTVCYRADKDYAEMINSGADDGKNPGIYNFAMLPNWEETTETKLNVCYYRQNWLDDDGKLFWESNLNRLNKELSKKYGRPGELGSYLVSRKTIRGMKVVDTTPANPVDMSRGAGESKVKISLNNHFQVRQVPSDENGQIGVLFATFKNKEFRLAKAEFDKIIESSEPGYGITGHVVQGQTIREPFTIYDWNCRPNKYSISEDAIDHRYVCMSRPSDASFVHINANPPTDTSAGTKKKGQIYTGLDKDTLRDVYKVSHTDGWVYIGSSVDYEKRFKEHLKKAKAGSDEIPMLYAKMRETDLKGWSTELLFRGQVSNADLLKWEGQLMMTHGGLEDMGLNHRLSKA